MGAKVTIPRCLSAILFPLFICCSLAAADPYSGKATSDVKKEGPFFKPHILQRPEPDDLISTLSNRPYGASILDVSEFFLGDIAVAVIFPSSDGSIDPSTEDWTQEELDVQVAGITAGMDSWATTFPGLVRFHYRFVMEVPTGYEPINRPSDDDVLWIGDVLAGLGYPGSNAYRSAYLYVDDLIRDLGTDWGAIYFCVDSSNDPDGYFTDGLSDYAYFGGPLLVTTSTHGGDGAVETPTYAAHEFAHLFYANDEYLWAFEFCDTRSGYLGVENQNSDFTGCLLHEDCIMKNGYLPLTRSCDYTSAQLGTFDRDGDGIPYLLDTMPVAQMQGDSVRTFREGDTIILKGKANVSPVRNRNPYGLGRDITTNSIAAVGWHLDNATQGDALPLDGIFDTGVEFFAVDLTGLGVGQYRLDTEATNNVGNTGLPASVRIIIEP